MGLVVEVEIPGRIGLDSTCSICAVYCTVESIMIDLIGQRINNEELRYYFNQLVNSFFVFVDSVLSCILGIPTMSISQSVASDDRGRLSFMYSNSFEVKASKAECC